MRALINRPFRNPSPDVNIIYVFRTSCGAKKQPTFLDPVLAVVPGLEPGQSIKLNAPLSFYSFFGEPTGGIHSRQFEDVSFFPFGANSFVQQQPQSLEGGQVSVLSGAIAF